MFPALYCDRLWIVMVSGWLWVSSRVILIERCTSSTVQMGSPGRKCKVGVKQLAVFACSPSVTLLPRMEELWKKEKVSAGITIYETSICKSLWFQKASQSGAARITALHPQSQKHISWWRGGRVCLRIAPKPLLILALNIYHRTENTPLHPVALPSRAWFITRSPSASSDQQRVHHSLFWLASVLFKA